MAPVAMKPEEGGDLGCARDSREQKVREYSAPQEEDDDAAECREKRLVILSIHSPHR